MNKQNNVENVRQRITEDIRLDNMSYIILANPANFIPPNSRFFNFFVNTYSVKYSGHNCFNVPPLTF